MKKNRIKWFFLILLLLLLILVMAFLAMRILGQRAMLEKTTEEIPVIVPEQVEAVVEDEGDTVIYKGETYRYKESITAVLCMGIDNEEDDKDDLGATIVGNAGQADMLMLAILDTKSGDVDLWNISRDAMTEVDIYNVDGEYVRTENLQACLAYAYGDGKHTSCENTVRAVSRLLYGMPIQSYAAIDLDVIRPLNDAVGGVEVTIHEGDVLPKRFKPGTTVLLEGDDVEAYVRSRRTEEPDEPIDSNNNRMARQKQYMTNFIQKALQMTKEDLATPVRLYHIAMEDDHMITNLNSTKIAYLTSIFYKVNFSEESFRTIPGEVVAGEKYAEFHVDDTALYEMILETFYEKKN